EKRDAELFKVQIQLANARAELELLERQFLKEAFPSVEATTAMVFGYLLADDRCLVCGSESHNAGDRIREQLRRNHCPACDSLLAQSAKQSKRSQSRTSRLQKLQSECAKLEQTITDLQEVSTK